MTNRSPEGLKGETGFPISTLNKWNLVLTYRIRRAKSNSRAAPTA